MEIQNPCTKIEENIDIKCVHRAHNNFLLHIIPYFALVSGHIGGNLLVDNLVALDVVKISATYSDLDAPPRRPGPQVGVVNFRLR